MTARPSRRPPLTILSATPDGCAVAFWSRVQEAPASDCWPWQGSVCPQGYGRFRYGKSKDHPGVQAQAHRFAYEELRCEIPDGLVLDHLCRNRACVNPWHLEPVTIGVNVKRGKGVEMRVARAVARTHCKRGHELTEDNVYHPLGLETRRDCRECKRLTGRKNYTTEKRQLKRQRAKERATS